MMSRQEVVSRLATAAVAGSTCLTGEAKPKMGRTNKARRVKSILVGGVTLGCLEAELWS